MSKSKSLSPQLLAAVMAPPENPIIRAMEEKQAKRKAAAAAGTTKAASAPKAEPKQAEPAAKFVVRKVKKGAPVYAIADTDRPNAGRALAAHTHAALTALGMLEPSRPAVPQSVVLGLIGQRAVTYHRSVGNFTMDEESRLRLTEDGAATFSERLQSGKVDTGKANAFLSIMVEGEAPKDSGIPQSSVYPVSPV